MKKVKTPATTSITDDARASVAFRMGTAVHTIAEHLTRLNPHGFDAVDAALCICVYARRAGIPIDEVVAFLYAHGEDVTLWDARDSMTNKETHESNRSRQS